MGGYHKCLEWIWCLRIDFRVGCWRKSNAHFDYLLLPRYHLLLPYLSNPRGSLKGSNLLFRPGWKKQEGDFFFRTELDPTIKKSLLFRNSVCRNPYCTWDHSALLCKPQLSIAEGFLAWVQCSPPPSCHLRSQPAKPAWLWGTKN